MFTSGATFNIELSSNKSFNQRLPRLVTFDLGIVSTRNIDLMQASGCFAFEKSLPASSQSEGGAQNLSEGDPQKVR